jgi:CRISPR-associated endonuclease/helicase Cas3
LSEGHLDRLSVLALLHDLGKTNLGFQNKPFDSHAPRAGHVRELALLLRQPLCDKLMLALNIEEMQPWFESAAELEPYLLAACGDRPSLGRLRSVA